MQSAILKSAMAGAVLLHRLGHGPCLGGESQRAVLIPRQQRDVSRRSVHGRTGHGCRSFCDSYPGDAYTHGGLRAYAHGERPRSGRTCAAVRASREPVPAVEHLGIAGRGTECRDAAQVANSVVGGTRESVDGGVSRPAAAHAPRQLRDCANREPEPAPESKADVGWGPVSSAGFSPCDSYQYGIGCGSCAPHAQLPCWRCSRPSPDTTCSGPTSH